MIKALAEGLSVTLKHMFKKRATVQYPEQRREYSPRFRGKHKLNRHEDGSEKCVGCYLCAVVCPANAIHLQAGENEEGKRYAEWYKIEMARCIYCGFCVDACPVEALDMTGFYEMSCYSRDGLVYEKKDLLVPHPGERAGKHEVVISKEGEPVLTPTASR